MTWPAALFVAIAAAFFAHRLTIGRDKISARRAASAKFRAAVLTALNGLYPLPVKWEKDMDAPLRAIFPALQTAVAEYRPFVPWWRRRGFDRTWFRYRCGTGREIDVQNYHHYIAFRDNPNARENFRWNVAALLAFAP